MALNTVGEYLTEARRLLQDTTTPYRYQDADLISGINLALLEARKMRADLFMGRFATVPTYATASQTVDFDQQYRLALLYYMVGHVGLRDAEASQDARAVQFMNRFTTQMTAPQGMK